MTTRPGRRRFRGDWYPTILEPRGLLDAGLAGAAPAVLDMGAVSRGAALRGAEATAHIDPGGSVTFRFALEAGGDYTLSVRHDGDGLALAAATPGGVAALDPGPAGPTRGIPLELAPGVYEVTASAAGGRPVFVDWDLLLNTGVGRADVAAAAAAPAVVLALPPSAAGATPTVAPPPAACPMPGVAAPAEPAPPLQSLAYPLAGPVLGLPRPGPPPQAGSAPRPDPGGWAPRPPSTGRVVADALRTPAPPVADGPAWADPPVGGPGPAAGPGPTTVPEVAAGLASILPSLEAGGDGEPAGPPWCRPAVVGPGLCVGAVVAARVRIARRRAAPSNPREVVRLLLEQVG